jgi:ribosome-binding ATPase YchF (GTP1/OBG family)
MTYLTTGPEETRAWTVAVGSTAPVAGSAIHTDFREKFIRAEVVAYDDLVRLGSKAAARDAGKLRTEGKEYIVTKSPVKIMFIKPLVKNWKEMLSV